MDAPKLPLVTSKELSVLRWGHGSGSSRGVVELECLSCMQNKPETQVVFIRFSPVVMAVKSSSSSTSMKAQELKAHQSAFYLKHPLPHFSVLFYCCLAGTVSHLSARKWKGSRPIRTKRGSHDHAEKGLAETVNVIDPFGRSQDLPCGCHRGA